MIGPEPHRRRRAFCITLKPVDTRQLEKIRTEIIDALVGLQWGKIYQLSEKSFAVDFHPHPGRYLFISTEPRRESVYLIRRRLKMIERESINHGSFADVLRNQLTHAELMKVDALENGVGLRFSFRQNAVEADSCSDQLVVQIARGNANVYLLDHADVVVARQREMPGDPNQAGERYCPPESVENLTTEVAANTDDALSDQLDKIYSQSAADEQFNLNATTARKLLSTVLKKKRKLVTNLESDLSSHGDPERWKQYGDLILANISSLRRENGRIYLIDLFDEKLPEISIDDDESRSLNDIAAENFRRFTKARNAKKMIAQRSALIKAEIEGLEKKQERLDAIIENRYEQGLVEFLPRKKAVRSNDKKKAPTDEISKFARKFTSSDGFQVLVGKKARDNDHLSFRIAKSFDTWMHAADFPGSHVVIQNPSKKPIPDRTLIEAAQLAAFYSDARELGKAAVNYTLRKFVNKPKRANPGAVSLASFKTILVKPDVPIEKTAE